MDPKKAVESLADVSWERLQQAVLGDLLGHLPKSLMFYTKGAPKKILESVQKKKNKTSKALKSSVYNL